MSDGDDVSPMEDKKIWKTCCGCQWSKVQGTLMLSMVLFGTITSAQIVGALIAKSMALLADCASMGLDTISYGVNLVAACHPEPDERKRIRNNLISSGVSYLALIGISLYFLVGGIQALTSSEEDDENVNAYIVLGFAIGGIVFDIASLIPYCLNRKGNENSEKANLLSAFSHVSADLLRSLTTLIEGIVILSSDINEQKADAVATLVVTSTIVLGMVAPLYQWYKTLRNYRDPAHNIQSDLLERINSQDPEIELDENIKSPLGVEEVGEDEGEGIVVEIDATAE